MQPISYMLCLYINEIGLKCRVPFRVDWRASIFITNVKLTHESFMFVTSEVMVVVKTRAKFFFRDFTSPNPSVSSHASSSCSMALHIPINIIAHLPQSAPLHLSLHPISQCISALHYCHFPSPSSTACLISLSRTSLL